MKLFTQFRQPSVIAVMFGLALSFMAMPGTAWSDMRDDVRDFHSFLRDRPRVAADLRANPNLVYSRRYLDEHEELARFLRRRPALREEIRYNPNRVFGRSYAYGRYDRFGRWR
jgi:hypothetical protein